MESQRTERRRRRARAGVAGGTGGGGARPAERAVAAVNGGYFSGDGNPIGALVAGGRVLSEPVDGRSALLLGAGAPPRVAAAHFEGTAQIGERLQLLDGVNRTPGEIPVCGGRGGDRPTERPDAVTTCTDPSELVLFTPEWGQPTPRRPGSLDALVRGGNVASHRSGGGSTVPANGAVLTATGVVRTPLRSAGVGAAVALDPAIRTASPATSADAPADIVGAGPGSSPAAACASGARPRAFRRSPLRGSMARSWPHAISVHSPACVPTAASCW